MFKLFLPYCLYLVSTLYYITKVLCVEKEERVWYQPILEVVCLSSICYQVWVEWLQLKLLKEKRGGYMEYFSFMNCLDLLTYMISTILIFLSMISLEIPSIQSRCVLAALISIMMWLKMLEWLRVFDSTAFFIKLILQTMFDILPFFVIFFIFIFMFGSALYILSMNRDSEEEIVDSIFHGWLFNTFIN